MAGLDFSSFAVVLSKQSEKQNMFVTFGFNASISLRNAIFNANEGVEGYPKISQTVQYNITNTEQLDALGIYIRKDREHYCNGGNELYYTAFLEDYPPKPMHLGVAGEDTCKLTYWVPGEWDHVPTLQEIVATVQWCIAQCARTDYTELPSGVRIKLSPREVK